MKKMLLFLVSGILLFTFTGCGKQVAPGASTADQNAAAEATDSSNQHGTSEAPKDTPSETPKETQTPKETSKENTGASAQSGTQKNAKDQAVKEMDKKIDQIIDALFKDKRVSQLLTGGNVNLNFLSKDEKGNTAPVDGVWEIELQVNQKKVAVVKIRDKDMKIISVEK